MKELKIKLMERMLGAELTAHLATRKVRMCHLSKAIGATVRLPRR